VRGKADVAIRFEKTKDRQGRTEGLTVFNTMDIARSSCWQYEKLFEAKADPKDLIVRLQAKSCKPLGVHSMSQASFAAGLG